MKLARILSRMNVGGPARTVTHLARGLERFGVETLLIGGESGAGEGTLAGDLAGVNYVHVPELRRGLGLHDRAARRVLARLLEEFDPDVVHTHAAKAGVLGRRAALALPRRPAIVHTYHGHSLKGYFPRPISRLFAALERRLAARTDALVAVSDRVALELALEFRVAPRERFRVIENGIDLSAFAEPTTGLRAAARARLAPRDAEELQLGVPARLVPIKNHALLFAALRRMRASPLALHLFGDGPQRAALEAQAAELPSWVRPVFHGFRFDLAAVLPGLDAVVLPSRNEGMPLALIEAMAAGCAVVATAVGGVPDLVDDGEDGLLARPEDPSALAAALERALGDAALRESLGCAARERARARFSIERVIEAHAELYRELLARPRAGS